MGVMEIGRLRCGTCMGGSGSVLRDDNPIDNLQIDPSIKAKAVLR